MLLSQLPKADGAIKLPNGLWVAPLANVADYDVYRAFLSSSQRSVGSQVDWLGHVGSIYDAFSKGRANKATLANSPRAHASGTAMSTLVTGKAQRFPANVIPTQWSAPANQEIACLLTTADSGFFFGSTDSDGWTPVANNVDTMYGLGYEGFRGTLLRLVKLPITRAQQCQAWENSHEDRDKDGVADKLHECAQKFMTTFGDGPIVYPLQLVFSATFAGIVMPNSRIQLRSDGTFNFGCISQRGDTIWPCIDYSNANGDQMVQGVREGDAEVQFRAICQPAPRTINGVPLEAFFGPCVSDLGAGNIDIGAMIKSELELTASIQTPAKMTYMNSQSISQPVTTEEEFLQANPDWESKDSWELDGWTAACTAGFTPVSIHNCLSWILSRKDMPTENQVQAFMRRRSDLVI